MKIIVETNGVDVATALSAVEVVARGGYVSEAAGIPHYCWHTSFSQWGVEVSVRRKRKPDSAVSFYVYQRGQRPGDFL